MASQRSHNSSSDSFVDLVNLISREVSYSGNDKHPAEASESVKLESTQSHWHEECPYRHDHRASNPPAETTERFQPTPETSSVSDTDEIQRLAKEMSQHHTNRVQGTPKKEEQDASDKDLGAQSKESRKGREGTKLDMLLLDLLRKKKHELKMRQQMVRPDTCADGAAHDAIGGDIELCRVPGAFAEEDAEDFGGQEYDLMEDVLKKGAYCLIL